MKPNTFSQLEPGTRVPHTGQRGTLLTGLLSLIALAVIGVAIPRFTGHAHASAAATPQAGLATSAAHDASVPPAADVFVDPESGAVIKADAPTF